MNDFASFEKTIIRELSCRLCLCTDIVKLKPLNAETKRKIRKIFGIVIRSDDSLPKAICHECLCQLTNIHLYAVKVDKTQKFLEFHSIKTEKQNNKYDPLPQSASADAACRSTKHNNDKPQTIDSNNTNEKKKTSSEKPLNKQKGDVKETSSAPRSKSTSNMKYKEDMPLEEFLATEMVENSLFEPPPVSEKPNSDRAKENDSDKLVDTVVLINGKPAAEGADLDKQISSFYKMECCICHEADFHFRSLMRHYKDKHGVPGYVTCCNKKFHYFHPKRLIEHMAFHLQPNIFMCHSCHENFETSRDLSEHQNNGGRSNGKILCPKCSERYPTYKELGNHMQSHRAEYPQCDYCTKQLKSYPRKKTVNNMEDLYLCSQCIRILKSIEKQEKELKERTKPIDGKKSEKKYQKFRQTIEYLADMSPENSPAKTAN